MPTIIAIVVIVVLLVLVVGIVARRKTDVVEVSPMNYVDSSQFGASSGAFRLVIEDVFAIKGRGTVVTGKIETGSVTVGQHVRCTSPDGLNSFETSVQGIEAFHESIMQAQTGDNIGILLQGITKDQVQRGMIIS
jgi:translation elongation factor EF-Tu-like GTPase